MDSSKMIESESPTVISKSKESLGETEEENVEVSSPLKKKLQEETRYKSFCSLVMHYLTLSLSSFYFGYIMAYISSVDFGTIINVYSITYQRELAQGLLVACIPIGGGIGALISGFFIRKLSRRTNLLLCNAFALLAGCLVYIPRVEVLIATRLVQGMCAGIFSSTVPLMMRELAPNELSGTLTSFHQIFISTGIFFAFTFSLIMSTAFNDPLSQNTWWIIFGVPIIVSFLQSFLLTCVYPYETPKYLFQNGEEKKGRQLIERIYKEKYVELVIQEIKSDIGQKINKELSEKSEPYGLEQVNESIISEEENKERETPRTAVIIALHLAALHQFCGINAVIAYGGEIVGGNNSTVKLALPILINFEQVIAALFTSYLLTLIGRKVLLEVGSFMACVGCGMIALGFFLTKISPGVSIVLIVFGLVLFMANFGFTIGPVVWVYLPEIVQPKVLPYATMVNWASAALIMLLFPVIKEKLPDKNPAILFLFFAIWSTLSYFINKKFVIETKNKGERQIFEEYESGREIQEV